jgi:hypothetical protein
MPDHAHLFVALPQADVTLAKWVRALRTSIGKTLLSVGYQKPHWQEGFLRSSSAKSRKLCTEMGIRSDESGARRINSHT